MGPAGSSDVGPAVQSALGGEPHAPRRRLGRWVYVGAVTALVLAFLALLGASLLRGGGAASSGLGVKVNDVGQIGRVRAGPAPDFQIQLFSGDSFRLSALRGKIVLVNYWASWCPPCRDEAPVLERAWQRYRAQDVVLVGLDIWDTETDARAFLKTYAIDYPNGPDPGATAAIDYGVTGIPETFFIRRDGTVARHWIGPLTDDQITQFIEELLR